MSDYTFFKRKITQSEWSDKQIYRESFQNIKRSLFNKYSRTIQIGTIRYQKQ